MQRDRHHAGTALRLRQQDLVLILDHLHEIEAFLTLAEELHFRRTSERLGLAQGRVSQTIRKLERRIGVPLFERSSRQVALTPTGRQLHADLAPAYQAVQRAIECPGRASPTSRSTTRHPSNTD
ncbi:LysR family transcriptional regulator [Nocardia huaxiensis]|uniref:LysR family transcriptional regulator n=1 Tax=Nocardia huaxiensis TaxID=2755382 RepID=UPI001E6553C1|nr:LysR family transcriptional regulator [Nocardia huaxiensis]UFS93599.1 LysR family transcriptional regulator [Nocardia huaxiensis]